MSNQHRLAGRYEIRSLIGRGGMAEVHLGYDVRLSRNIAIKMLRTDLARDSIFQTRFRREAQASASLNHPNIVAVHDTGDEDRILPDGSRISVPYIIMEYVEGHTVRELLSDGQPVPIPEAVEITTGVLNALEYSHARGLVHRDIKPGNVMLTTDGKVKVMDFGIARALEDSGATMTSTDAVVGTAQYLSPEQARGETVDPRSDLYSTGCLLFELLTGRPPFKGDSAVAVAYQHVSENPPAPSSITPDISEQMDRVVLKSLAKNPADRYANAARFRSDLHAALAGSQVSAPAVTTLMEQNATATPTAGMPATNQFAVNNLDPYAQQELHARRMAQRKRKEAQERREKERRKKRNLLIGILSGLVILLIGGAVFAWYYLSDSEPEMVTIPKDIVGMSESQAREVLTGLELNVVFGSSKPSDTVDAGLVADTDPHPGTEVQKNSKVTVFLSSGPSEVTVPDVSGLSQEQARKTLEDAGLKVGNVTTQDDPKEDKDHVIETSPKAGESIENGGTVNLIIASGYVTIDNSRVIGQPKDTALNYLQSLGLSTNSQTEVTDEQSDGTVISINPQGKVESGTQITVTIAQAPPKTPADQPSTNPDQ